MGIPQVCPGKDLVIGSYAYLDGEMHVRVAMAMDAICKGVCAARPTTGLAYLNTPTQVPVLDVRLSMGGFWSIGTILCTSLPFHPGIYFFRLQSL